MKKSYEKFVIEFPSLYDGNMYVISCGEGWMQLLEKLSSQLEPIAAQTKLRMVQVKQKFGGLRAYSDGMDSLSSDEYDFVLRCIREAEDLSYKMCETCGMPGHVRGEGWIRTLCDICEKR